MDADSECLASYWVERSFCFRLIRDNPRESAERKLASIIPRFEVLMRRSSLLVVLALVLAFTSACTNKKVNNPLANVGSKQPDKVLFDRSMDAMKHNRFD